MEPTRERKEELLRLLKDYREIGSFLSENEKLSFMQFDYAVVHGLALFMLEPDFSFEELERDIDSFLSVLPYVKRIFAKPRIHLKERREILPTESVRIIDNNTIQHCLSHSELWTDIQDGMVKPAKLQTRTYVDNYGIYENLVFCQTVDGILSFVRMYMRFFKELIYTNQTIEINFLERLNHLNYFLALGKLHVGYGRNLELYYPVSMRCMHKLQQITDNIVPLLKRPVYSKNKSRLGKVKIRKTNILSMDKDYRQIYRLAKSLSLKQPDDLRELSSDDFNELQNAYFGFCEALSVFAVGHFNFVCKESAPLNFNRLNVAFRFQGWELKIKGEKGNRQTFSVTVRKDKTYKIIFIPTILPPEMLPTTVTCDEEADEYVMCTPFEEDERERCLLSITGIESFRRVQQIILRGMIYADNTRTECPFCHNLLTKNEELSTEENPVYECFSCRTQIYHANCPTAAKPYFYTKISGLKKSYATDDELWLVKRKAEAQMFFRNITKVNEDMEILCPHCGKVHTR